MGGLTIIPHLERGFFEAGFNVIKNIEEGAWTLDILIYPVVFTFRHGIELYIKHFIVVANRIVGGTATMKKNHSLMQNWGIARSALEQINHPWFDQIELGVAEDIIADIVQIDPDNQVFRYPEDKTGKPYFDQFSHINAEVLRDGMRVLFDLFEKWESGLVAICDERHISYHSIDN